MLNSRKVVAMAALLLECFCGFGFDFAAV